MNAVNIVERERERPGKKKGTNILAHLKDFEEELFRRRQEKGPP